MELTGIPGNPVPEGMAAREVRAADGTRLRAAALLTQGARGTVVIAGGRGDFIERYFETAGDLARRGFAVAAFDFRGQGGSDRPYPDIYRSRLKSFAEYDDDLASVMAQLVQPECPPPYIALGHSTGAHVLLRALRQRNWFARAVLSAPLLGVDPGSWPMPIARALTWAMPLVGCGRVFLPGQLKRPLASLGFPNNAFTGDQRRFARDVAVLEAAPSLGVGGPSFSWLKAALASIRELEALEGPRALRAPVLIVAAGRDRVVRTEAARAFARRLPGVSFLVIEEALHELLCERDHIRAQFLAAFDSFAGVPQGAP